MQKNHYEIERKFLINTLPEAMDLSGYACYEIEQAYISRNPTIRIRKLNETHIFTFKQAATGADGLERFEFERELSRAEYENLLSKTEGYIIKKKRYIIPLENGLKAELDIYEDQLEGFMNVEVEFGSVEGAKAFEAPEWFGEEVTHDRRYSNAALSIYGKVVK